jgi:serine/threonine-protein kinase HipA
MSDPRHLVVLIDDTEIGDLGQDRHGQIKFTYRDEWRRKRDATPLSLSMPLARAEHGHKTVDPFLRGLLPDNEEVLRRWGRRFSVSPNNPFALLTHVGEDVAGAAQFVREDRLDEARAPGAVEPVDEAYIEERLRALQSDRAAWTDTRGEFSLAGAQSKFALYRSEAGDWGIPHGRSATTHIMKPSLPNLADQEVNEHLCLRAAYKLGMPTASSMIMTFGSQRAIVLERYDRYFAKQTVRRVHQEDFCQALGVHPDRKYQRGDGGPGPAQLIALLRTYQTPDIAKDTVETLCRALAYNWVIYGPDAHAKNYSLLLSGSQVRLAPLYDVASVLPYPTQYELSLMAMAMAINGKYQNNLINASDWRAFARAISVDPEEMLFWVNDVVSGAPEAFSEAVSEEPASVQKLATVKALLDGVAAAAKECLEFLDTNSNT